MKKIYIGVPEIVKTFIINSAKISLFEKILYDIKKNCSEFRNNHILKTAEFALYFSKNKEKRNIHFQEKAVLAALLHDITKEKKKTFMKKYLKKIIYWKNIILYRLIFGIQRQLFFMLRKNLV
ncbi:MAG: HD domain-containing protein [Spirochaetia bacterium]|nr:HD domain-containing protein [Spirochaetia bacterium]